MTRNTVQRNSVRAVLLFVMGVFLIWARNTAAMVTVMFLGAMVVAYGLYLIISVSKDRAFLSDKRFGWPVVIFAAICVCAGLFILIRPVTLINIFAFVTGVSLSLYGLYRTIALALLARTHKVPFWDYPPSVLSLILGIVVILFPEEVAAFPYVLLGIGFILNAFSELLYSFRTRTDGI